MANVVLISCYDRNAYGQRLLELRNVGSPDLMRSGWTVLRAFTIADSFHAVVKVLVIGPVVGAIFGGIGGLIARQRLTPTRRSWTGAPIAGS
jgi:hypothetical protein